MKSFTLVTENYEHFRSGNFLTKMITWYKFRQCDWLTMTHPYNNGSLTDITEINECKLWDGLIGARKNYGKYNFIASQTLKFIVRSKVLHEIYK
jgi:hypothetical protein